MYISRAPKYYLEYVCVKLDIARNNNNKVIDILFKKKDIVKTNARVHAHYARLIVRENYCWLAGSWFGVREKYY